MKNGWLDEQNRAYIIYTVDAIMEDLGCAKATCVKIMKELDSEKGIGLIEKLVETVNGWLWSPFLIAFIVCCGLYFSIRTRFLQIRHVKEMVRLVTMGKSSEAGVSSFQALTMSLSV